MEQYLNQKNKSISDAFDLPECDTYEKDVYLASLLRNYADLSTLYNDPDWYYEECALWWRSKKNDFVRQFKALEAEYNPIHNYDRTEELEEHSNNTRTNALLDTVRGSNESTLTMSGSMTTTDKGHIIDTGEESIENGTTETTYGKTSELQKAAMNSDTYHPSQKETEGGKDTVKVNNTTSIGNDRELDTENKLQRNATDVNINEISSETHHDGSVTDIGGGTTTSHTIGNIGVMTTQQMILDEIGLRKLANIYKIMGESFANELLLCVWCTDRR